MALRDPWAEFADEVSPTRADDAMASDAPIAAAVPAQTPAAKVNDEFAAMAEPVDPNDPAMVYDGSTSEWAWGDEAPAEATDRLSPEDEAQLVKILAESPLETAAGDARRFFASKMGGNFEDNFDEIIAHRAKTGVVNKHHQYNLPNGPQQDGAFGAYARGVGDIPTAGFLDEAGAVVDAIGGTPGRESIWNSDEDFTTLFRRNLDINRGIIDADERDHGFARVAGQLTGGLLIPSRYQSVALKAGGEALRAGKPMAEARAIAARAASARMIKEGTAIGAAHGAGSGETMSERVTGAVAEGAIGAAGGAAVGKVAEAVAPGRVAKAAAGRAAPLTEEQELIRAADRQGIEVLPADVGGPVTRRATSMTAQTIAGGAPIKNAAERMTEQAKAARDRIAALFGTAFEREAAGNVARSGAQKAMGSTRDDARAFYAPAEKASKDVSVAVPKALAKLDEHIAELETTPGGAPGLATMKRIRKDLLSGKTGVAGIRRMRTTTRDQFIKDNLAGSDTERRIGQIIDAAAEDVSDGLKAAGMDDVAAMFRQGDAAWRKRAMLIDTTFRPILGNKDNPKSGEQIIKTLTADLEGNQARAVRFLRALPPKQQDNVRASIIGALGKAKAGQQGSEGTDFSLGTFLTNWNQIGERAKAAYFGVEARAALNDLAKVAEGAREAQGYANTSNTGGAVGNLLTLFSGVGGIKTFGATIATQYGLGRLLASPRFARWLARAPKVKDGTAHLNRLNAIARSEPAIANELLGLRQALLGANDNLATRAAASGEDEDDAQ